MPRADGSTAPQLSPYLRPLASGDGTMLVDNGVTGRIESVTPFEEQILRALWDSASAPQRYAALAEEAGAARLERAEGALRARGMIFDTREACEAAADAALAARLRPVPFVDQVELTNLCPMRCGFCPRGVPGGVTRPTGFMDLELFRRLLAQLPPEQARYHPLVLNNLGESLLHPGVDRFVAAAAESGVPAELSVNPSLLTPELAARLLDAGIVRLVLSLDGMDDATSTGIRGPAASYGRAERNLDALIALAARRAAPPAIVVQMIDLHRNRHQHAAFLQRWGRTGAPFVTAYVKDLDGPDPDTGCESARPLRFLCTFPFSSVSVAWDGTVVPCCRDANSRLPLGDLRRATLPEIWRGEAAQALRAAYLEDRFPPGHLCAGCAFRRGRFAAAAAERHPDRVAPNPLTW